MQLFECVADLFGGHATLAFAAFQVEIQAVQPHGVDICFGPVYIFERFARTGLNREMAFFFQPTVNMDFGVKVSKTVVGDNHKLWFAG